MNPNLDAKPGYQAKDPEYEKQLKSLSLFSDEIQVSTQVKVNSAGQTEFQQTSVGGWNKYQVHFKQTFNKCGTFNDPFSDRGFGQRSSSRVNYGVERFGKFMFYLKTQIQL